MVKKIFLVLGAVIIVGAAGVGTFFILQSTAPQRVEPTSNNSQAANTPPTQNEDTSSNTSILQSTRDSKVKNTLTSIATQVQVYMANNRGVPPSTQAALDTFKDQYLTNIDLTHPVSKEPFMLLIGQDTASASTINYWPGYTCESSEKAPVVSTSKQDFALSVILPSETIFCAGS